MRPYTPTSAASPTAFLAGASAISAAPITTSTPDPIRKSVWDFGISNAWIDIVTAWAKLDTLRRR